MGNVDVITWLESPEGETWSKEGRDRLYRLAEIKDDIDPFLADSSYAMVWHA